MTGMPIAQEVVAATFRIHTALGPGLLESVYDVRSWRLNWVAAACPTTRQQPIPVVYENVRIDTDFRADLVVEDKVIVEVNRSNFSPQVHKKQLLTYLWLADKCLGLLLKPNHHNWRLA